MDLTQSRGDTEENPRRLRGTGSRLDPEPENEWVHTGSTESPVNINSVDSVDSV